MLFTSRSAEHRMTSQYAKVGAQVRWFEASAVSPFFLQRHKGMDASTSEEAMTIALAPPWVLRKKRHLVCFLSLKHGRNVTWPLSGTRYILTSTALIALLRTENDAVTSQPERRKRRGCQTTEGGGGQPLNLRQADDHPLHTNTTSWICRSIRVEEPHAPNLRPQRISRSGGIRHERGEKEGG